MGSDDFISLEPTIISELQEEENGSNLKTYREDGEMEEGEHEQDMDLESDPETPFIKGKNKLVEFTVIGETQKDTQPENNTENASSHFVSEITVNSHLVDEGHIIGVKRARMTYEDEQPCARVVYNSITKESKKKLIELMQQWSDWHAQSNSSLNVSEETLECGVETFFPALHVGLEKTSVSFWVDNQVRNEDIKSIQLDNDSVPLYDRGYTLGSTSLDGSVDSERIETLEASRCFNCGSYSHSLKECPKPRDNAAVNNARKQHNANRKSSPASQGPTRYYLNKPKGKFDDLKPGVLGPETRKSLGIGEFDPPPWLNRMRALGYPPGYLDAVEDEDEPSGITIFGLEEPKVEYEDGELPEKADPIPAEKKMTVDFPGINAPIPVDADDFLWSTSTNSSRGLVHHHRPSWLMDPHRDHQVNDGPHRGHHYRDEGPPPPSGTEHGYSYSPRYSPYDHNNSSHGARSPIYGRSLSDRGWHGSVHSAYTNPNPNVSRASSTHPYLSSSGNHDHYHQHQNDRWHHRN